MRRFFLCVAVVATYLCCYAQQPSGTYTELTDTKPHDSEEVWNKQRKSVYLEWGNTDTRYRKLDVPTGTETGTWEAKAWRGERINAQAVLWTKKVLKNVTVKVNELKKGEAAIPTSAIKTNFVRYVMTDELNKDGNGGCGHRPNKSDWDSSVVADVLDNVRSLDVQAYAAQPIWLNVWVPANAEPGKYKGELTVSAEGMKSLRLPFEVQVLNRTLPAPKDWKFDLDLWQNPYAVARYYNVPLWSKSHFDAMRPIMKMLADAGQKSITASIMYHPWAAQTQDAFDSMITRVKKLDGTWEYRYTVFDKWVEFMTNEIGITGLINCYTMIPWALDFDYYDEATNRIQFIHAKPGDAAYAEYWGTFLKDFAKHLREKNWFERTAISMDERALDAMQEAIKVIRNADPDFKITLAGNYHSEIQSDLFYYCIPFGNKFPDDVMAARQRDGKISTYYTCCTEAFPNMFTFSAPAEAAYTAIHAIAEGYEGYLRWAYNSWTIDPLRDSRFRTWAAGDTYSVYPGRSSIRFERLTEGIQDCEKIRLLREEGKDKNLLRRIDLLLERFKLKAVPEARKNTATLVKDLHDLLND